MQDEQNLENNEVEEDSRKLERETTEKGQSGLGRLINFVLNRVLKITLTTAILYIVINLLVLNFMFQLTSGFHVINEHQVGVRFRLGKFHSLEQAGLHFAIPILDTVDVLNTWEHVVEIPSQSVATSDLITLDVDGVIRYRIRDPLAVVVNIDDASLAGVEIALATIKEAIGEVPYQELISERRDINQKITTQVNTKVKPWGIEMVGIEIKRALPSDAKLRDALGELAISELARESEEILSKAEINVANVLKEASEVLDAGGETAKTLRFLQMLETISTGEGTVIMLPMAPSNISDLLGSVAETSK
ncbi:MAG: SPFH domain-containing protein [Cyanobacteria bacterium J06633_2]